MRKILLLALGFCLMSNARADSDGALAAAIGFSALSNIGTTAALANNDRDISYALQKTEQVKDAANEDINQLRQKLEKLNEKYKRRFIKMRNVIVNLRKRVKALEAKTGIKSQEVKGEYNDDE